VPSPADSAATVLPALAPPRLPKALWSKVACSAGGSNATATLACQAHTGAEAQHVLMRCDQTALRMAPFESKQLLIGTTMAGGRVIRHPWVLT